jgi:uncharacterized membrane protein YhiD involved in acid resistance
MRFITTFDPAAFVNTAVCLLAAFVLGTLIGAERQYRQRSAGLRTNALVALGAARRSSTSANALAGPARPRCWLMSSPASASSALARS